jgi:hypothetical protein
MPTTTPLTGTSVPIGSDTPDWGPKLAESLTFLEKFVNLRFASASARNTAVPAPTEGMSCWLNDVNQITVYDGTQWVTAYDATRRAFRLLGTSPSGIVGTPPGTVVTAYFLQAGTNVVPTDGNGYFTINYPVTFPNGVVTVVCIPGESPGGASHIFQGPDLSLTSLGSTSLFNGRAYGHAGNAQANTTTRVDWVAVGW